MDYALERRQGNRDRVHVTGDSSGGMMTELLLALYPEVFKAGAAFAGMPAGCRGPGENGNGGGYSGACAGGNVSHSEQEWGDIARSLSPGYDGPRPRVQLLHGDNDTTIRFPNHTEAVKQWANLLDLDCADALEREAQLGLHPGILQSWQDTCGITVLDAFTQSTPASLVAPMTTAEPMRLLEKAPEPPPLRLHPPHTSHRY